MQKSRSYKKNSRLHRQSANISSKVLLELSSITSTSKDKSNLIQHMSDRTFHQPQFQIQNQNWDQQSSKSIQKLQKTKRQQCIIKNDFSLSNKVLHQIMNFPTSKHIKSINNDNSKLIQKNHNNIIIFSKQDIKKGKRLSQTKKNKKLTLGDKENNEKTINKSKSSYFQAMKGEPIICSIKIHSIQQNKNNNVLPLKQKNNENKNQYLQNRRSSISSKRSSINLFQQEDFIQRDFNDLKRQILAKISTCDQNICSKNKSQEGQLELQNEEQKRMFLKKKSEKVGVFQGYEDVDDKQKCRSWRRQEENELTGREKEVVREQYLFRLDELNVVESDIKREAGQFIVEWDQLIASERNLKKYKIQFSQAERKYQSIKQKRDQLNSSLLLFNKNYLLNKKSILNNSNNLKQNIILQTQKIHSQIKKKVFKKDLEDIMIFNMKVVLPSLEVSQSNISYFNSQNYSNVSYSNISVFQLYEQLMKHRSCKKYGMILKKQINNMNMYDSKAMNEYLKKLNELETAYHKSFSEDPSLDREYLDGVQELVNRIEQINSQLQESKEEYWETGQKMRVNEQKKVTGQKRIQILLKSISKKVYEEFLMFQTGLPRSEKTHEVQQKQTLKSSNSDHQNLGEIFCQLKTIQQFEDLLRHKYAALFQKYKNLNLQKKLILSTLKSYC